METMTLEIAVPEDLLSILGLSKVRAVEAIKEFSTVRLQDRNQQFSSVLSEDRVQAITRGEIEPATRTLLLDASAEIMTDEDWFEHFHRTPKPLSTTSVAG